MVAPNDHRSLQAEHAIQDFKAHFISTGAGTHDGFLTNAWDLMLPNIVKTLNMLRPSK